MIFVYQLLEYLAYLYIGLLEKLALGIFYAKDNELLQLYNNPLYYLIFFLAKSFNCFIGSVKRQNNQKIFFNDLFYSVLNFEYPIKHNLKSFLILNDCKFDIKYDVYIFLLTKHQI